MESASEFVGDFSNYLSLTECCFCRGSLRDPVMLKCLHHSCRTCLESVDAGAHISRSTVVCPVCFEATDASTFVRNSILYTLERMSALRSDDVCCCTCDVADEPAAFWCADCYKALCASCYSWHNRFHLRHRSTELEVARTWPLNQHMPVAQCSVHKRLMEAHCFTCTESKCFLCSESCRAACHDFQLLSHDETRKHVYNIAHSIRITEKRLSGLLSSLQAKCQSTRASAAVRDARKSGHALLVRHKRSLQDAAVNAFDKSISEVCANLSRIWYECVNKMYAVHKMALPPSQSGSAASAASNIELLHVTTVRSLCLLRERSLLKTVACLCVSSCRVSLRHLFKSMHESGTFVVDTSVPLTAQIVLNACLGAVDQRHAAPSAPLVFGQISVSFQTPVSCYDLAVTQDGHVLLPAGEHGLLVYGDRGQQLSTWRPKRQGDGRDDVVNSVAALSDGRAVVGVVYAQLVVLLRHSRSDTGDMWMEEHRVVELQSPPQYLAVHGDLLAITESRPDGQPQKQQRWVIGRHVQLVRLSSGQLLYRQSREYDIQSTALTALCIVTASLHFVKRNSGLTPFLVDACSHAGEFLWRYETSEEERVMGVCAAYTWSRVYVTLMRRDGNSSRVIAIGGADGRQTRDVLSSRTHAELQLPAYLSLASGKQHRRTLLAVLGYHKIARQLSNVVLYEAASE